MTIIVIASLKQEIELHVRELFARHQKKELVYHNLHHTELVVSRAKMIAESYNLSDDDLFILYAAAWFHDTGHLFVEPKRHEEESVQVTSRFFNDHPEVPPEVIAHIERCILATKMPQVPCTKLEKILCDADTYHLATPDFFVTNELVKEEMQFRGVNVDNWDESSLKLLQQHVFHSDYCKTELIAGKVRNIELLRERMGEENSYHL